MLVTQVKESQSRGAFPLFRLGGGWGTTVIPLTHFDIFDFFEDPSGKIDHLIGDGNVCYG